MKSFDAMRRDFLRVGSLGMAATGLPAIALATQNAANTAEGQGAAEGPGLFDVRKYGATGDGKTLDTPAVNRAIEAADHAGGGLVVFPAGTYLCFSIRLKSQVHLVLQQGSAIVAADSPKPGDQTGYNGGAYDAAEPNTAWDAYQDYGHNHWHNSLLRGEDLHDLSITGPGLLWG
ncbi:MAG: glycosyl hydrolase family 28-related protein, partial [Terracidiphilus sp.]